MKVTVRNKRRRCWKHGKAIYRTKAAAQRTIWFNGGVMNAYICDIGSNRWHIGHKKIDHSSARLSKQPGPKCE